MFSYYLKMAWRHLRRQAQFSFLNLLGMSLAWAAALLIIQYISFEYAYDRYLPEVERVFRVGSNEGRSTSGYGVVHPGVIEAFRQEFPEVAAASWLYPRPATLTYAGPSFTQNLEISAFCYADSQLSQIFPLGLPENWMDPYQLWLSRSSARQLFGERDPLGKSVEVYDDFGPATYLVAGIFEDLPTQSSIRIQAITGPTQLYKAGGKSSLNSWRAFSGYIKLHEGMQVENLEAKIASRLPQVLPIPTANEERVLFEPITATYLYSQWQFGKHKQGQVDRLWNLGWIALIILVLAWINYINLASAQSLARAREVGIRKILGSGKKAMVRQFLTESLLLQGLALGIAFTLVQVFSPLLSSWQNWPEPQMGWSLISWVGLIFLGVALAGSFLAAYVPARILAAFPIQDLVRKKQGGKRAKPLLRHGLVIAQFALALCLITATTVVFLQIRHMRSYQLGVNLDQKYVIERPNISEAENKEELKLLQTALAARAGISSMLLSNTLPGTNFPFSTQARLQGSAREEAVLAQIAQVQPEYFSHFEIPLLYGTSFQRGLGSDAKKVLLNEAMVKQLGSPLIDALIGKQLMLGDSDYGAEIMGIVKDYHHFSLHEPVQPSVFQWESESEYLSLRLQVSPDSLPILLNHIKSTFSDLFPTSPYHAYFLDEQFLAQYGSERAFSRIISLFTGLSVLIACLGLTGLSAFSISRRTKEIGIRKVLGASVADIFHLLSRQFLLLVGIGSLVGMPLAWWAAQRWLENFASQAPVSVWLLLINGIVLALVAWISISSFTLKAAQNAPIEALRDE